MAAIFTVLAGTLPIAAPLGSSAVDAQGTEDVGCCIYVEVVHLCLTECTFVCQCEDQYLVCKYIRNCEGPDVQNATYDCKEPGDCPGAWGECGTGVQVGEATCEWTYSEGEGCDPEYEERNCEVVSCDNADCYRLPSPLPAYVICPQQPCCQQA